MKDNGWNLLGITSPDCDSGKTLTTINLAIALSMDMDLSVIIVDCNIRKPSVGQKFGLDCKGGLIEYLLSTEPDFRKYLVKTLLNNLYILPCEKQESIASEILTSHKMKEFLHELKSFNSCIVLFDLPSVFIGDDVMAFYGNLDAMMLVIEDGKTESDKLARAAQFLERTPLIGSVLNKSKHTY